MADYVFAIHYHRDSGEIRNWGTDDGSTESYAGPDYAVARFEQWRAINPFYHRVDPATADVIDKTAEERKVYDL